MNDFSKIIEESRCSIEKVDLQILLPIVAATKPQAILEIGMHQGYSMELWRKTFTPDVLIGMDINPPTIESYIAESGMLWNTDSHVNETQSIVYLRMAPFNKIDFLFIDGDHSYDGVKKDFEMYSPLVRKGGIIAFHDALYHADKTEEVDLYWDYRFRKKYRYVEIKAGENSTGIGLIWL